MVDRIEDASQGSHSKHTCLQQDIGDAERWQAIVKESAEEKNKIMLLCLYCKCTSVGVEFEGYFGTICSPISFTYIIMIKISCIVKDPSRSTWLCFFQILKSVYYIMSCAYTNEVSNHDLGLPHVTMQVMRALLDAMDSA